MTLPAQSPTRRKVALRPRTDRYTLPRFPEPARREYVQPYETYDPRNEPRPFSWRELADPTLIVAGVMTVLGGGLVLAFWFVQ